MLVLASSEQLSKRLNTERLFVTYERVQTVSFLLHFRTPELDLHHVTLEGYTMIHLTDSIHAIQFT